MIYFRDLCKEHEESESKCLEMYEKLKEDSKAVENQRDQVFTSSLEIT